jgi:hypothetical protein
LAPPVAFALQRTELRSVVAEKVAQQRDENRAENQDEIL